MAQISLKIILDLLRAYLDKEMPFIAVMPASKIADRQVQILGDDVWVWKYNYFSVLQGDGTEPYDETNQRSFNEVIGMADVGGAIAEETQEWADNPILTLAPMDTLHVTLAASGLGPYTTTLSPKALQGSISIYYVDLNDVMRSARDNGAGTIIGDVASGTYDPGTGGLTFVPVAAVKAGTEIDIKYSAVTESAGVLPDDNYVVVCGVKSTWEDVHQDTPDEDARSVLLKAVHMFAEVDGSVKRALDQIKGVAGFGNLPSVAWNEYILNDTNAGFSPGHYGESDGVMTGPSLVTPVDILKIHQRLRQMENAPFRPSEITYTGEDGNPVTLPVSNNNALALAVPQGRRGHSLRHHAGGLADDIDETKTSATVLLPENGIGPYATTLAIHVVRLSVTVSYTDITDTARSATDDGLGGFTGDVTVASSIDYDTGAITVTTDSAVKVGTDLSISYSTRAQGSYIFTQNINPGDDPFYHRNAHHAGGGDPLFLHKILGYLSSDSAHANRGGGSLHALAVPSANSAGGLAGFMSPQDKEYLDDVSTGDITQFLFNVELDGSNWKLVDGTLLNAAILALGGTAATDPPGATLYSMYLWVAKTIVVGEVTAWNRFQFSKDGSDNGTFYVDYDLAIGDPSAQTASLRDHTHQSAATGGLLTYLSFVDYTIRSINIGAQQIIASKLGLSITIAPIQQEASGEIKLVKDAGDFQTVANTLVLAPNGVTEDHLAYDVTAGLKASGTNVALNINTGTFWFVGGALNIKAGGIIPSYLSSDGIEDMHNTVIQLGPSAGFNQVVLYNKDITGHLIEGHNYTVNAWVNIGIMADNHPVSVDYTPPQTGVVNFYLGLSDVNLNVGTIAPAAASTVGWNSGMASPGADKYILLCRIPKSLDELYFGSIQDNVAGPQLTAYDYYSINGQFAPVQLTYDFEISGFDPITAGYKYLQIYAVLASPNAAMDMTFHGPAHPVGMPHTIRVTTTDNGLIP